MKIQSLFVGSALLAAAALPFTGTASEPGHGKDPTIDARALARTRAYHLHEGQGGVIGSAATTAQNLLTAMDIDPAIVVNPTITGNIRQYTVYPSLGTLVATTGGTFAYLSTGVAGAGTPQTLDASALGTQSGTDVGSNCADGDGYDCVVLKFSFVVPGGMHSIKFKFNFMSAEFPEFVGTIFNDQFAVKEESPSYSYDNIVFDSTGHTVNINSAFFNEPCTSLGGTGFDIYSFNSTCDAGGTGLLTTQAPVEPGETVTLTFSLRDRGDGIYDTAVLLDDFIISEETVPGPNTGGDVKIDWLSPKSGTVNGGTQVQIHGQGFLNVQSVAFGGQPALFQTLDEFTLVAVTPPGFEGAADVSVTASPNGSPSTGVKPNGFIYYDDPSSLPLAVQSVDPPQGPKSGGVEVNVHGTGFTLDSQVTIGGHPAESVHFISGDTLVITTPAGHGSAEVRVTNLDGATSALTGGYLYLDDGSGHGSSAGGCGCDLGGGPGEVSLGAIGLGAIALAWMLRRRRLIWLAAPAALALTACNDSTLAPVNSAPVADAGPSSDGTVGNPVQLDGSGSHDFEDGTLITFAWQIVTKPDGSAAQIDDPSAKQPHFTPDQPGLYRIGLVVADQHGEDSGPIGYGGTNDDNLTDVVVLPFLDLQVSLAWDSPSADLDLHLIRQTDPATPTIGYWDSFQDCFYGIPDPDWGNGGVISDNPKLDGDVDTGLGPETIKLASPQDTGVYTVLAHEFNSHGSAPTNATVDITLNGTSLAEVYSSAPLTGTDAVWVVGTLTWPESTFTELNQFTSHQLIGGPPH